MIGQVHCVTVAPGIAVAVGVRPHAPLAHSQTIPARHQPAVPIASVRPPPALIPGPFAPLPESSRAFKPPPAAARPMRGPRFRPLAHDLLCLSSELFTGKSLPALLVLAHRPLDRVPAVLALTVGALLGALYSVWAAGVSSGLGRRPAVAFGNRALQLAFSAGLSLGMALQLARALAPDGGLLLALAPALCLCGRALPQRHSTPLLAAILALYAMYVGFITPADAPSGDRRAVADVLPLADARRPAAERTLDAWRVVGRALQLFACALYACVQHAPTQAYEATVDEHKRELVQYGSKRLHDDALYAACVAITAALLRLYTLVAACLFTGNAMHVLLEADRGWRADRFCASAYMVALLYQACWTLTQLREQVLPQFRALRLDQPRNQLKALVLLTVLASYAPARHVQAVCVATNALLGCSALTVCLTLRRM